jgi:1,2-phenylacetyl-CoA epoxidase PaaB subunit
MSGRRGRTAPRGESPATVRFEVFVRVGDGTEAFSMRVPDIHAADGADALRVARGLYGHLAVVRGIDATRA